MLFIEEWSNWWGFALAVDDSKVTPEQNAKAGKMAESLGKRASDMVIDNRRFLASKEYEPSTSNKPASPLPWSEDMFVAAPIPDQDAAYIAHACNAYPKLVEALRIIAHNGPDDDSPQTLAAHILRELGEA